jgi:hypothetical protein
MREEYKTAEIQNQKNLVMRTQNRQWTKSLQQHEFEYSGQY